MSSPLDFSLKLRKDKIPPSPSGTGDGGYIPAQITFEKLVWWAFLIALGWGMAVSINHVDQLQADSEWKQMLLKGEYPGVHIDVEPDPELRGSVLPSSRN